MRYAETDKMGIAYYANYFIWFEVARSDLLRACGETYRNLETEGIYLPVVEAHCKYALPARYDDRLTIETRAILKSQVRVEFRYKLERSEDQQPIATGHTVLASTDTHGKPKRLPQRLQTLLT